MTIGKVNISDPESNSPFLWKYFDLHRFIYLITEQKLFFTRLDKFEDPYEGVATRLLRREAKYSKITLDKKDPKSLSKEEKQILNEKKLHDYIKKEEIQKTQNRQYVNCWFSSDRESMAMWNLYSNEDSVTIKVNFNHIRKALNRPFAEFVIQNGKRLSILGSEVTYLKLNPFDESLPKQKLKYSAFKKDENEYRFLIVTLENLDKIEPFYSVPIEVSKLEMTVISHPNMESWKFENLKKLLALTNTNVTLEKSATLLREKNYG